jgi:hypothetical protein
MADGELSFNEEDWERIRREVAASHPGEDIVGWYRTRPGSGPILSAEDQAIHREFFFYPAQIALVVDPLGGEEAVFGRSGVELRMWFRRDIATLGAAPPATASPSPRWLARPAPASAATPHGSGQASEWLPLRTCAYLSVGGLAIGAALELALK